MTPREEESVASGRLYREDSMVSTVFKWNARIAGVGVERGVGRAVRGTRRYDQKAGEAPKRILRMNLSRVHIPTLYGQVP